MTDLSQCCQLLVTDYKGGEQNTGTLALSNVSSRFGSDLIRKAPLLAGVCWNAEIVAALARKVHAPISSPALEIGSRTAKGPGRASL